MFFLHLFLQMKIM